MSKFKYRLYAFLIILILFSVNTVYATVATEIATMYEKMGIKPPATLSGGSNSSFQAMGRNYYVGGSAILNYPIERFEIVDFNPPHIKASCGGIDLYLGSFSFINSDKINQLARAIAQNAVGYAFEVALSTMCPTCKQIVDKMQKAIRDINSLLSDTCSAAKTLVNSGLETAGALNENGCIKAGLSLNLFGDTAEAKENCVTNSAPTIQDLWAKYNDSGTTKEEKTTIPMGNLVWEGLKTANFNGYNSDIKQLLLSVSGTVVRYADTNNKISDKVYAPLINQNELSKLITTDDDLDTYCTGTATVDLKTYKCVTDGCANISESSSSGTDMTETNNSVEPIICQIYKGIDNAVDKVVSNTALSDDDKYYLGLLPPSGKKTIDAMYSYGDRFKPTFSYILKDIAKETSIISVYIMLSNFEGTIQKTITKTKFPRADLELILKNIKEVRQQFLDANKEVIEKSVRKELDTFNQINEYIKNIKLEQIQDKNREIRK